MVMVILHRLTTRKAANIQRTRWYSANHTVVTRQTW